MKPRLETVFAALFLTWIITGCSEKTQNTLEPNTHPLGERREIRSASVLPTTTISFDVPERAIVTLKMNDGVGDETAVLLDHASMDQGLSEVEFDAGRLPSGVYFYVIDKIGIDSGTRYVDDRRKVLVK